MLDHGKEFLLTEIVVTLGGAIAFLVFGVIYGFEAIYSTDGTTIIVD